MGRRCLPRQSRGLGGGSQNLLGEEEESSEAALVDSEAAGVSGESGRSELKARLAGVWFGLELPLNLFRLILPLTAASKMLHRKFRTPQAQRLHERVRKIELRTVLGQSDHVGSFQPRELCRCLISDSDQPIT